MPQTRTIRQISRATPTLEGAGVHLKRAFGFASPEHYDPFLLFDDFRSDDPAEYVKGFPWHPHRGIETITYVLKGDVEHGDSLGNSGTISGGDVQWMTAASGIVHQEMPRGDGFGSMHGFQLWLNLPAGEKMGRPRYRDITRETIPVIHRPDGSEIRLICGSYEGETGPVTGISTRPHYFDVTLPAGAAFRHPFPAGDTVIAYVIGGSGRFTPEDENACGDTSLILFGEGGEIAVAAGPRGLRFLLFAGRPLRQPIAWRGPIVMNSESELDTAFREYREGTFLKHRHPAS